MQVWSAKAKTWTRIVSGWRNQISPSKRKMSTSLRYTDGDSLISLDSQFSSVTQMFPTICDPMDCSTPGFPIHHQLLEFTKNSHQLKLWCHPTFSSSVIPFCTHLQSFPASGSFQMSQLFTSGGQSIEVSASTATRPMNIQEWFPLGWTGWISFQSMGLSRVFSNTTVQKHQFFGPQLSL